MKNDCSKKTVVTVKRNDVLTTRGKVSPKDLSSTENFVLGNEGFDPVIELLYAMYLENQKEDTYKEVI